MKRYMLVGLLLAGLIASAADKRVSDLDLLTQGNWAANDLFMISDMSVLASKKTTVADFDGRYVLRSETLGINKGGTGATDKTTAFNNLSPMSASGDLIYGGSFGAATRLPIGTNGYLLTVDGGLPTWKVAPPALPLGGTAAQVLTKVDATDGNATWQTPPPALPLGGTAGQVLSKIDSVDGNATWVTKPPITAKGQLDASATDTLNFQVPNNRATRVGTSDVLFETGDKNLLKNASFEASTVNQDWTTSAQATISSSTNRVDGAKSMRIAWTPGQTSPHALAVQTVTLAQNMTGKVVEFTFNIQAISSSNIGDTWLRICLVKNGVAMGSSGCSPFNIPFTSFSTAAFIPITVNVPGDVAGTVYDFRLEGGTSTISPQPVLTFDLDDSYTGLSRNISEVNIVRDMGKYTPTITVGSGTVPPANVVVNWFQVGSHIKLTGTLTFTGTPSSFNALRISLPSGLTHDFSKMSDGAGDLTPLGRGYVRNTGVQNYDLFIRASSAIGSGVIEFQTPGILAHTGIVPVSEIALTNTTPYSWAAGGQITFTTDLFPVIGLTALQNAVRVDQLTAPRSFVYYSNATYTPTPGTAYIIVKATGGGGGGGGSGTGGTGGSGGTGGNTTFGSLITANGGGGGFGYSTSNSPQTSYTVTAPAVFKTRYVGGSGGAGDVGINGSSYNTRPGGIGGINTYGGAGASSPFGIAGGAGSSGTGAGGAGAGANSVVNSYAGSGGTAGITVEAQVNYPVGPYSIVIGNGGTAGTAGTSGFAGGPGGSGVVEVTEYPSASGLIIPGNVTVNSKSNFREEYATVAPTSASVCAVSNPSSSWITSTTPTAAGDCTINFTGFSAQPNCQITSGMASGGIGGILASVRIPSLTSSSLRFLHGYADDSAGSISGIVNPSNEVVFIRCLGPQQ